MPRVPVPLPLAYRLLNHGPATLVGTRAGDQANVMAAQWVMPIDYDPPKLAVVVDGTTFTRKLVDRSGTLSINIPDRAQAALAWRVGSTTGAEVDKLATIETFASEVVDAPLVAGCLAWLECRVIESPALAEIARGFDLFVVEVVAASADARYWDGKHVSLDEVRTLHHLGGGRFVESGNYVDARAK
jgi:flavin reductase (DIM6/NTAB) family NADH-FMN oxidoreductase RutF